MPSTIDSESTLLSKEKEIMAEELTLDIQGLTKTYPNVASESDGKKNWKRMLVILMSNRENQAMQKNCGVMAEATHW